MNLITIWSVVDKDENVKFNHIEDEWKYEDFPKPIKEEFTNQKAWAKLNWKWEHGYLIDGKIIRN